MESGASGRKGKPKVKSGCRTCKARKLKCDEGRPACQRCLSSGRFCDGYGIWGGGSSTAQQAIDSLSRPNRAKINILQAPASIIALTLNDEEKQYFECFRARSTVKLPGTYRGPFWQILLLQAGCTDKTILNAILALSSVQNREAIVSRSERIDYSQPQDNFALRHYVKAISTVRSHLEGTDRAQRRVALISCLIFICLEMLRGCFEVSELHYKNGIQVMEQMKMFQQCSDGILRSGGFVDPIDDWIVDAFSRLQLQFELINYCGSRILRPMQIMHHDVTGKFASTTKAWHAFQRLTNEVFRLTNDGRAQYRAGVYVLPDDSPLHVEQQCIRDNFDEWCEKVKGLRRVLEMRISSETWTGLKICHDILETYQTLVSIMLETCLPPSGEMDYDLHTDKFLSMMVTLVGLWDYTAILSHYLPRPGIRVQIGRSIADVGVIAPLYYTALKCRVHRLRIQAIRMLESVSHREGLFDCQSCAVVARKVLQIEEEDFYSGYNLNNDFGLLEPPTEKAMETDLPTLPESHRMDEIEMNLLGAPMDRIHLSCTQARRGFCGKNFFSTYDICTGKWTDSIALETWDPPVWTAEIWTSGDDDLITAGLDIF